MPVLDRDQLDEAISQIVTRLRDALAPAAIYMFGSYVYGRPGSHSDIDLIVVVEDSSLDPYDREAQAFRALRGIRVPIDVQVYTRQEFDSRACLPVSFERTVRKKGRLVYAA